MIQGTLAKLAKRVANLLELRRLNQSVLVLLTRELTRENKARLNAERLKQHGLQAWGRSHELIAEARVERSSQLWSIVHTSHDWR